MICLTYWCYIVCSCFGVFFFLRFFLQMRNSDIKCSHVFFFFLNADLWLSKSHIWISGLRFAVNQYMQVWHYSMQLSFILFLFFYSPHSQWLFIVFFYIYFFQAHLIPVEHPSLKQTPPPPSPPFFTLTLHSDVYNTSLVWRRVCLSDSGRRPGRWIVHMIVKCTSGSAASNTHVAAVEERNVLVKLFSCLFHWVLLKFVLPQCFRGK